jgi:hypothetical protein
MKILYLAFLIVGAVAQGPRDLEPRVFAQESPGITVPAGTVIPVSLMRPVSSRHAREGDGVYARTIFPLAAGGQVVVPIGTYVQGRIVRAVRPGKVSGRAEITINFHTMVWE